MDINQILSKKPYRQFIKFTIVGGAATAIDWAAFFVVREALTSILPIKLQIIKQIAKAITFILSASFSFSFNRRWTFRSQGKISHESVKFLVVSLGGLAINSVIFFIVTSELKLYDIFGLIIATAIVFFWNFIMNKKWTFKVRP